MLEGETLSDGRDVGHVDGELLLALGFQAREIETGSIEHRFQAEVGGALPSDRVEQRGLLGGRAIELVLATLPRLVETARVARLGLDALDDRSDAVRERRERIDGDVRPGPFEDDRALVRGLRLVGVGQRIGPGRRGGEHGESEQ
jgi:hypothetical protein